MTDTTVGHNNSNVERLSDLVELTLQVLLVIRSQKLSLSIRCATPLFASNAARPACEPTPHSPTALAFGSLGISCAAETRSQRPIDWHSARPGINIPTPTTAMLGCQSHDLQALSLIGSRGPYRSASSKPSSRVRPKTLRSSSSNESVSLSSKWRGASGHSSCVDRKRARGSNEHSTSRAKYASSVITPNRFAASMPDTIRT